MFDVKVNIEEFRNEIISEYSNEFCDYGIVTEEILKLLEKIKNDGIEIVTGNGTYWSGILYSEPWCDLEEELDLSEDDIIEYIITNHFIVENGYLKFINQKDSNFYHFFKKYEDGYGGNIPCNLNTIIDRIFSGIEKLISDDPESYGNFEEF